jgi:hypothetical protein
MAHLYREHPDYAGEVDHLSLLAKLADYDGWALSTSAKALPYVLSLVALFPFRQNVRVAAWVRRTRTWSSGRFVNCWEPVVFIPARTLSFYGDPVEDVLEGVTPRRRSTLPGYVIGAKPPAFCAWLFGLLGALPGDALDDMYPGSGMVTRSWAAWCGPGLALMESGEAIAQGGQYGG